MNVTIELRYNRFPELKGLLRQQVAAVVRKTAFDIEAVTKASMVHSSPPPSEPGQPPGVDMGNLKDSIRAEQESELVWVVATGVPYAPPLEFGTRRMAARPFMRPAVEVVRPDFYAAMREVLK